MIESYTRIGDLAGAEKYGAAECIACGCCAYICPAKRPLLQKIAYAKTNILAERKKKAAAEKVAAAKAEEEARAAAERAASDKAESVKESVSDAQPSEATPPSEQSTQHTGGTVRE